MSVSPRTSIGRSLRDLADEADAERFVGRGAELAAADDLLDPATPSRILFLHGSGGIGKSTTLRAIGRRASDGGRPVIRLDPRNVADDFDVALERALADPADDALLIVDEADALGSRLASVRDRILDSLPASARVVFGGREGPDASWSRDGLDAVVVDVALAPLTDSEADRLLAKRGVEVHDRPEILAWAQGSPLALSVAAAVSSGPGRQPTTDALEERLTAALTGDSVLEVPADVLEVAALAPVVDARLLAAALPARPTRDAMRQLAALPVVERVGDRLVLHRVLAAAVRARLMATAPDRARLVTRRIVEQLASRAHLGDIRSLVELSYLIEDPDLRKAVANQPSTEVYPSHPRPGELEAFARDQGFDREPDWPEVASWLDGGADYRLCVRRRDGSIVMFAAFDRLDALPDLGPVTSSLQQAGRQTEVDPRRSFAGVVLFSEGSDHERAEAARLGSGALMHQHGVADMQAMLIHYPAPTRRPKGVGAAIAAKVDGDLERSVALSDFRPFGAVGFVERIVLAGLGFEAEADVDVDAAALLAVDDDPQRQAHLIARLDQVFGGGSEDQRLRRAIELVHLSPRRSETECLATLHVSRSTWFRLLRQARERVLLSGAGRAAPVAGLETRGSSAK